MLAFNIPIQKPGTVKRGKSIESEMVKFYMAQKFDIDVDNSTLSESHFEMYENFIRFLIEKRIVLPG